MTTVDLKFNFNNRLFNLNNRLLVPAFFNVLNMEYFSKEIISSLICLVISILIISIIVKKVNNINKKDHKGNIYKFLIFPFDQIGKKYQDYCEQRIIEETRKKMRLREEDLKDFNTFTRYMDKKNLELTPKNVLKEVQISEITNKEMWEFMYKVLLNNAGMPLPNFKEGGLIANSRRYRELKKPKLTEQHIKEWLVSYRGENFENFTFTEKYGSFMDIVLEALNKKKNKNGDLKKFLYNNDETYDDYMLRGAKFPQATYMDKQSYYYQDYMLKYDLFLKKHSGIQKFLRILKEEDQIAYLHLKEILKVFFLDNDEANKHDKKYIDFLFCEDNVHEIHTFYRHLYVNNCELGYETLRGLPPIVNKELFNKFNDLILFYKDNGFIPWEISYQPKTISIIFTDISDFIMQKYFGMIDFLFSGLGVLPFIFKDMDVNLFSKIGVMLYKEKKACKEFINLHSYYDKMNLKTLINRLFQDNYSGGEIVNRTAQVWQNHHIPINFTEMGLQAEYFIEKLIYNLIPEFPGSFIEDKRNKRIMKNNMSFADEGTILFEEGLKAYYNLMTVTVRDNLWYYLNPLKHPYTQREIVGDYWYLICHDVNNGEEMMAVLKDDEWIGVVDFKAYLLSMREETHFLRERQTVLYDVAKYYDLQAHTSAFDRRIQWSKDYSQTLYELSLTEKKRARYCKQTYNEYKDIATISWEDNILWYPKEIGKSWNNECNAERLRLLDWWETLHKDLYGPEPLVYIYAALSLLLVATIFDFIVTYFKVFRKWNFFIKYKRSRTNLNIMFYRWTGFSFFYTPRLDGVSYTAQLSLVLSAGLEYLAYYYKNNYIQRITRERKWKDYYVYERNNKIHDASAFIFTPKRLEVLKPEKKWSYGNIINKQSDLWFLWKRFLVDIEHLNIIFNKLFYSLFGNGNFTIYFLKYLLSEYIFFNRIWMAFITIPIKMYNFLKNLIFNICDIIINFPTYVVKLYEFFSHIIHYTSIFIIDSFVNIILFIKDEILLFFSFIISLLIDWVILIKFYLVTWNFTKKFEWFHSFIREWHFEYHLWQHILWNRFNKHTLYSTPKVFIFPDFYMEQPVFGPSIFWQHYHLITNSELIIILQAETFEVFKEALSISAYRFYDRIENSINQKISIMELLKNEIKIHGFWKTFYNEYALDEKDLSNKMTVIKEHFIKVKYSEYKSIAADWMEYFSDVIYSQFIQNLMYASHLYGQYSWWFRNSPLSIIYYPLISLWRYFVHQTLVSFDYLYKIIKYRKLEDWYNNFSVKRIWLHFKIYFSEKINEILYEIHSFISSFFEIMFYPFIGIWWYLKKSLHKVINLRYKVMHFIYESEIYNYLWITYNSFKINYIFKYSPIHILEKTSKHFENDKKIELKENNEIEINELMSSKDKYVAELLTGFLSEYRDDNITRNWKLSSKALKSIDDLCTDLTQINLFDETFPLTPNEKVLDNLGLLNHINRNISLLKKVNLVPEALLIESIFYEKTYLPKMEEVDYEDYHYDFKIHWLPDDIYFTLPKIRLFSTLMYYKDSSMYWIHLYENIIDILFKGEFGTFVYKVFRLGPYIIPDLCVRIKTLSVETYKAYGHKIHFDIKKKFYDLKIFLCDFFMYNYGIVINPKDYKIIFKFEGNNFNLIYTWYIYILNCCKDHLYYWFFNVPYGKWKLCYTYFLRYEEVLQYDEALNKTFHGYENKYKLDTYRKMQEKRYKFDNININIIEKINIWLYYYINKFSNVDILKDTKYEMLRTLIRKNLNDYNKLKNIYIERKFKLYHSNFFNKYYEHKYIAHWYNKFENKISFESHELIKYYDLRIKYSFYFFFKSILNIFNFGLSQICFDFYKFISSFFFIPLKLNLIYNYIIKLYNELYSNLLNLVLNLQKDFINLFIYDLHILYKKIVKLIYEYSILFFNESKVFLYYLYVIPIKDKFNIDITSLYTRSLSDFFIHFFYLEERLSFSDIYLIIKLMCRQTYFGLKNIVVFIFNYCQPYINDLYIFFSLKMEPFINLYLKEISNRVNDLEFIYNKYLREKVNEFIHYYNNPMSIQFKLKILYYLWETFILFLYTLFEISVYCFKCLCIDTWNFIQNSYYFIQRLGTFFIEVVVLLKYTYIKSIEILIYYTQVFLSKVYNFTFILYTFVMNVVVELISIVSKLLYYLSENVLSLNSFFKYPFVIVNIIFEFIVKIIEIISLFLKFIIYFEWDKYSIYFNMYFTQIYSYLTNGSFWWDNPLLLRMYIKLIPIIEWIAYNLLPIKDDVVHVLIRGDIGRGLPFLIGDDAVRKLTDKQKINIKEFFEYQEGLTLGNSDREITDLWTIDTYIKDYVLLLDKSNMPMLVKKFFYLQFLDKTFYEAFLRCSIRPTDRYGDEIKKLNNKDVTPTSSSRELVAYFKDLLENNPNFTFFGTPTFGLSEALSLGAVHDAAAKSYAMWLNLESMLMFVEHSTEGQIAIAKAENVFSDYIQSNPFDLFPYSKWYNDSVIGKMMAWTDFYEWEADDLTIEDLIDIHDEHDLTSAAAYFREFKDSLETYEFAAFNQKIYNFYLDQFGPSFAYILYHFPGKSLQLNDARFNYAEKVQFLRNFIYLNDSFALSNLSMVNRLNSLDFYIYMKHEENFYEMTPLFQLTIDYAGPYKLNPSEEDLEDEMVNYNWSNRETSINIDNIRPTVDTFTWLRHIDIYLYGKFKNYVVDTTKKKYFDLTEAIADYLDITYGETYGEEIQYFNNADEDSFGFGSAEDDDLWLGDEYYYLCEHEWDEFPPRYFQVHSVLTLPEPLEWVYNADFYNDSPLWELLLPYTNYVWNNDPFITSDYYSYLQEDFTPGSATQFRRSKYEHNHRLRDHDSVSQDWYTYSTGWDYGLVNIIMDSREPVNKKHYADFYTWQQAFFDSYLVLRDYYYTYGLTGEAKHRIKEYETVLINGNPWLDVKEVNRVIRERMNNKPLCYDYWVHYEDMDTASSSLNKFENLSSLNNIVSYDAPSSLQMGFQDPASPMMEGIIDLHHDLFFFIILISVFVSWILFNIIYYFNTTNYILRINLRNRIDDEMNELAFDFIRIFNGIILKLIESLKSKDNSFYKILLFRIYLIQLKLIYWQETRLNKSCHEKELEYLFKNSKIDSDTILPNNMTELFKYIGKNDYKNIEYFYNEKEKKGYFISKENTDLYNKFKNDPLNSCYTNEVSSILNNLIAVRDLQLQLNENYFNDIEKEKNYISKLIDEDILKYENFEEDFVEYKLKEEPVWFPQLFTHNTTIEIIWTIIPAIILIFIAVPSFSLLYAMDQIWQPLFTIKVLGNQWYWSYEYC